MTEGHHRRVSNNSPTDLESLPISHPAAPVSNSGPKIQTAHPPRRRPHFNLPTRSSVLARKSRKLNESRSPPPQPQNGLSGHSINHTAQTFEEDHIHTAEKTAMGSPIRSGPLHRSERPLVSSAVSWVPNQDNYTGYLPSLPAHARDISHSSLPVQTHHDTTFDYQRPYNHIHTLPHRIPPANDPNYIPTPAFNPTPYPHFGHPDRPPKLRGRQGKLHSRRRNPPSQSPRSGPVIIDGRITPEHLRSQRSGSPVIVDGRLTPVFLRSPSLSPVSGEESWGIL